MIDSEKVETSPTLAEVLEKYRREGLEKGKKLGIAEGVEKGRVEGRLEGALIERKNLAKELIRENFPDEKIAKMMRLTIDEVRKIREKI